MSYLLFLLLFLAPPIGLLTWSLSHRFGDTYTITVWRWIALISTIAFVYTTPWDNYLVYRGVWSYGVDRVIGTVGYVPIEEYAFFVLQPVLTGLWLSWLLAVRGGWSKAAQPEPHSLRGVYTGFWLVLTLIGGILSTGTASLYLGLILAWASPVLAGMAWLSTPLFRQNRSTWALGVAVPTVYLWIADRIAIGAGIWDISDTFSFDLDPLGLPVEEAVFFLITNILVVQGLMMFLSGTPLYRDEPRSHALRR